ncbi:MAG: 23S rRNA (adenine(2503)-C(2))-methyltransferase RlmN [Oscillospiraceae bacterium]
MDKEDIQSYPLPKLTEWFVAGHQPAFRGAQVFEWLHGKQAASFGEMTNLPLSLRESLETRCLLHTPDILRKQVSADGTVKYLYGLSDGSSVETVLMDYRHGTSLCISTQVGCRMGCSFCASTKGGLVRNLTAAEMLGQVYASGADSGKRIGSIVLMGIGEPLDNLDNVLDFMEIISTKAPLGLGLGLRHLTLSTCGLVDKIALLAEKKLPITLSISLHAVTDRERAKLMPVAHRWKIAELMEACNAYFSATGRRVTYEYALMEGVNDSPRHAEALAALLRGQNCHVNLIPLNPVDGGPYRKSRDSSMQRFRDILERSGVPATLRRSLGQDISAACGQLRNKNLSI